MSRRPYKQYLQSTEDCTLPKQTLHNRNKRLKGDEKNITKEFGCQTDTADSKVKYTYEMQGDHVNVDVRGSDGCFDEESGSEDKEYDDVVQDGFEYSYDTDSEDENPERNPIFEMKDNEVEEEEIFKGGQITKLHSSVLLSQFISHHKLTQSETEDLLMLIRLHLPSESNFFTSAYALSKFQNASLEDSKQFKYCDACNYLYESQNCPKCFTDVSKGEFITFDPLVAISRLLKLEAVKTVLESHLLESKPEDRKFGVCYQKLQLQQMDFTCILNTDGVPIFKSSKTSIWPVLYTILELPSNLRRKHMQTFGIWVSKLKPPMNPIFDLLLNHAKVLATTGLSWQGRKNYCSRVYFPVMSTDSVARPLCQGVHQFNGQYGCNWCLEPGESIIASDNVKKKWIFKATSLTSLVKRDSEGFRGHLKELNSKLRLGEKITHVKGVKFASKLMLLPKFNIVDSFVYDYMHSALLGTLKFFTLLWIDSRNHGKEFYLGRKISEIDDKLAAFKIPRSLQRNLRSMLEIRFWKANEWKTWLLTCCIALEGILSSPYLMHISLFCESIFLLCKENPTLNEVDEAEQNLFKFVGQIETLYGKSCLTYNNHILLHAAACVRNWGSLSFYSNFDFENENGVIKGMITGTHSLAQQLRVKVTLKKNLEVDDLPELVKSFKQQLCSRKLSKYSSLVGEIRLLGNGKILSSSDSTAIEFKSCLVKTQRFCVEATDTVKRCDSFIKFKNDYWVLVKIVNNVKSGTVIGLCKKLSTVILNTFVSVVTKVSEKLEAVLMSEVELEKPLAFYENGVPKYLISTPNPLEAE